MLLLLGFCGRLLWVEGQLRHSKLDTGIEIARTGAYTEMVGTFRNYQSGRYWVFEMGGIRLASQYRKCVAPSRGQFELWGEHSLGVVVNGSATSIGPIGWSTTVKIDLMIKDGLLAINGRDANLLGRPRLILLDRNGNIWREEELPADTAPPGLREAAEAAPALRAAQVAAEPKVTP